MTFTKRSMYLTLVSSGAVMPEPSFEDVCFVVRCVGVCLAAAGVVPAAVPVPVVPVGAPPVPVPLVTAPVPFVAVTPAADRCELVLLWLSDLSDREEKFGIVMWRSGMFSADPLEVDVGVVDVG